ncbi:hypothetical protein ACFQVD_26590 [Streptosporangium amethystogenes subsp. fukuiense]|uniref:Uncharacterized protein n=1 Tax=Streptosporangium amethystogenes subsp. fukuiense TaxID=698418 RepID=A0ABW2T5D6_9ACTN
MHADEERPDPIPLQKAAEELSREWSTLRDWPARYKARKVGKVGRVVFYDFWDLSTIDAMKNLGLRILPTPEERDEWRRARKTPRAAAA